MCSSEVFVFVILLIFGSFCSDDEQFADLLYENESVSEEPLSPVVCNVCACADGVVDCNYKNLRDSFSVDEWSGLKYDNITEVYMSGNSIELFTQIAELPIRILNISNSKINQIDDECFKYLADLETLDLSGNQIISLNRRVFWGLMLPTSKFRHFTHMRHLSLANNELHTLPKDPFGFMQELTFLDLSGNPLGIIDQVVMGALSDLTFLKELRMSSCELEALPEGLLRRQRRLERLDISDNRFSAVPAVLSEAVNMLRLNFDRNPITELNEDASIPILPKLQELSICRCSKLLSIGPSALGGLESLVSLRICDNLKLSRIDDDFLTWYDDDDIERRPLLKELYLHNNNLTEIDSDFLFRWDHLQQMDFSDNPFVCDCRNQWTLDVLVPFIQNNGGSADDMICHKPPEFRGLSFTSLAASARALTCALDAVRDESGTPDTAIVLGVLIGVFATFPIVLTVVLLWKRGYFAKCRRKMNSEAESDGENDAF